MAGTAGDLAAAKAAREQGGSLRADAQGGFPLWDASSVRENRL